MQHVFEYILVKKLTPEEVTSNKVKEAEGKTEEVIRPKTIHEFYTTESNRKSKVYQKIVDHVGKMFDIKREDIFELYLKPWR